LTRYRAGGGGNMSPRKQTISAVIIAKNEGERISICLDALTFCDAVVVVDNGSEDDTAAVARAHHAKVVKVRTDDFSKLRNEALCAVTTDWVLYVDADEIVGDSLAASIRGVLASDEPDSPKSYLIKRINYYLGQRWPGSEWMLRLFMRDALVRWKGELHETPETRGTPGKLAGELKHDTHRTLSEMVEKTNRWSETEAELRLLAHHPRITWWRLIRVTVTGFFHSFVTLGGWRAGTVGWVESIYQGFSLFVTYAKLWEKQLGRETGRKKEQR